ncbi:lactonase [Leptospira perdikensis]|uniref:Lactonase n=1 Tax=Leptospira perdikensis TaxID=2484948 RepID=A0A4R9JGS7_9LEPT|nr:lactonase [Leptospira perdikensis]TGL37827.1 lactonase [Leptospira perdikensis]
MKKTAYLLLLLCFGCTQYLIPKSKFDRAWYSVLAVIGISANDGELPDPVDIVSQPNLALPTGTFFDSPDVSVSVNTSNIEIPSQIGSLNVPIGKVYDIDLKTKLTEEIDSASIKTAVFSEPVVLEYSYNREELESAGFLEEFQVFYFSKISNQWEPLREIVVDQEKGKVFAKTDHFTPFILTAVPKLAGTGVAAAPACLSEEMPISGSSGAVWTQINEHFKYYKDRNYTLISNNDFSTLDFSGAYGIATCNGGAPSPNTDDCGPFSQHKYYNGNEYIKFTAFEDITVYVMYDSRGSQDATWLTTNSWVLTDKQITTTDGVGYYKVYQKQFLKNEVVTMHGNRQGIPSNAGVETNYWVVVKPNDLGVASCLTQNNYRYVQNFFYITLAAAGSDSATFLWTYTKDPRFENIIVRRKKNFPPSSVEDGVSPNISEIENIGFRETGLDPNSTYYYAIYARNAEGALSLPDIYRIETGLDSDNDGITDIIESSNECLYKPWHDYNCNSNPSLADSDGDGKDDLFELIYNTKMDSSDITPPVISKFELLSKPITSLNYGIFYFEAEESINNEFRYLMTYSPIKPNPSAYDSKIRPDRILGDSLFTRLGGDGNFKDFYLWIKDSSGNISLPAGPIRVTQSGHQRPKYIAGLSNGSSFNLQSLDINGELVNAYSSSINMTSVSDGTLLKNLKWGKIPRVFYVQGYKNGIENSISVFSSEAVPAHLLQRINVPYLESFIISDDGRNLYILNGDYGYRISKYIIQSDGTLIFDKESAIVYGMGFEMVYNGFNQSIYIANGDFLNQNPIYRLNAETLEIDQSPQSLDLHYFTLYNFRFHPEGKFCYYLYPGNEFNITKCEVNPSNGNLKMKSNVLEAGNLILNFEITADGNYMVVVYVDYPQLQFYNLILYRIDKPTGNLIETDRKVLSGYQYLNKFKIDQSSQFVFFLNNDKQINYYIINQNNGKFYGPIASNLSGYEREFEVQSAEHTSFQVQTNIEHLNQPGFVHGYNDVKYPLPFVSLVGNYTNSYLLNRAINQPIRMSSQNMDLSYMSCGKKVSDYEETIEIKNNLGQDRSQIISGNIWNRTISIQNLVSDISFSGRYRLHDISSNCKPNLPQSFVDFNITKKRISPVYLDLKLLVGQKPTDLDAFTSVNHSVMNGQVSPSYYYRTTCTIHEYGCNFIKIDKPAKVFYCDWHHATKVFEYYRSQNQCFEKEPNTRRLFHLTLITNVDHSVETSMRWNKYKITEP